MMANNEYRIVNFERVVRWLAALLVVLLIAALAVGAEARPGPAADWECPAGQSCHVLLQPGSEVWILTADGRVRLDVFGADVARVGNVEVD